MGKTLVIFDIDGTLLYSNKVDGQCFADTYQEIYGIAFPTIDWLKFPHVTDDTIFKTAVNNQFQRIPDVKEINDFKAAFVQKIMRQRELTPEAFHAVSGAKAIIDYLLNHEQFIVGIGTGGWEQPAAVKLDFVGIPKSELFFEGADGNPTREDILNGVVSQVKAKHQYDKVVYVGDAPWDVQTTRNLGMKFIGIRRRKDHDWLYNLGATQVLSDYKNIDNFLHAIANARPPLAIGNF